MNWLPRDIILNPLFPAQTIVIAGVLVMALALYVYGRGSASLLSGGQRFTLAALRIAALMVVVGVLLRPMRRAPREAYGRKSNFYVLIDSSTSMNTCDVDGETRIQRVNKCLQKPPGDFLTKLSRDHELRFFAFSDQATPMNSRSKSSVVEGQSTDLTKALNGVAATMSSHERHAGMLLISDGHDNAGGDLAGAALAMKSHGVPVWTLCVGSDTAARDLHVTAGLSQNFLFKDQPAELRVTLIQSGYENIPVNVHLHRDDEYVAAQQVILRKGIEHVAFTIQEAQRGLYKYRVSVDPLPDEKVTNNNKRSVFARVVEEKASVLLVEGRPNWDSKFLLRALQKDPNLNVSSIFHVTPTKVFGIKEKTSNETLDKEVRKGRVTMPNTLDEMARYDCLLLGKDMDRRLNAMNLRMIKSYLVERGGSVVFIHGPSHHGNSDLALLEPVEWADETIKNLRFELTPDGRMSSVFMFDHPRAQDDIIRSLPAMTSITRIKKEKSMSVVLAVAQTGKAERMAVVAYQRYGKGKVMSIGAQGLWKWAFLPPQQKEFDGIYERFWRQVVLWMIFESEFFPSQEITFRTARYQYKPGDQVNLTVSTRHIDHAAYTPRIELHPPEGETLDIRPANKPSHPKIFSASFTPPAEGEYRAVLHSNIGKPEQSVIHFTVYSDQVEDRLVAADHHTLERISRTTRAECLTLDQLGDLPAKVRTFGNQAIQNVEPHDIWDILPVFVALCSLLGLEWYLRRLWGMV